MIGNKYALTLNNTCFIPLIEPNSNNL